MPTYSYSCKKCQHSFDVQQSLSEPSLKTCPECAGELIKIFGQVGVTFKGSGFYQNDFGSNSKTKKSE